MLILFPSNPSAPNKVEPSFEGEAQVALKAGSDIAFYDMGIHLGGEIKFTNLPKDGGPCVYRGWILPCNEYSEVYNALMKRGVLLLNNPAHYVNTSWFPEWYEAIQIASPGITPNTYFFQKSPTWEVLGLEQICDHLARVFGDSPLILKDFIKSQKHHWFDACYISSASDKKEVTRVTQNFLDLQGDTLQGGLVYREFQKFKRIGTHSKSRMPISNEYRFFVIDGKPVACYPYWSDQGQPSDSPIPPWKQFELALQTINSRFYTVDVGELESGDWMIIEVGDGGASGVPGNGDLTELYQSLQTMSRAK